MHVPDVARVVASPALLVGLLGVEAARGRGVDPLRVGAVELIERVLYHVEQLGLDHLQ